MQQLNLLMHSLAHFFIMLLMKMAKHLCSILYQEHQEKNSKNLVFQETPPCFIPLLPVKQ